MFVARCGDFNNLLVIDLKPSHLWLRLWGLVVYPGARQCGDGVNFVGVVMSNLRHAEAWDDKNMVYNEERDETECGRGSSVLSSVGFAGVQKRER
jgi:hypothetical protein